MITLHRIRDFALAATLGVGALVGSVALACETPDSGRASIALFVDLGHMTVVAPRDAAVADLGSMTVSATRLPGIESQVADLGAMTVTEPRMADLGTMIVTAPRIAETQVADLGGMTVAASRIKTVMVAARPATRAFN
jgi:hypothetical protein